MSGIVRGASIAQSAGIVALTMGVPQGGITSGASIAENFIAPGSGHPLLSETGATLLSETGTPLLSES